MIAQYARQEEVWEPISDWGREFKAYLNRKKEAPLPVKQFTPRTPEELEEARQRKLKIRREWKRKNYQRRKPDRYCACARALHANNVTGICGDCAKKKREQGVKYCACGVRLGNRSKVGKCSSCIKSARKTCSKCPKFLNVGNKSGLCVDHSGLGRQLSYLARRKKAA